MGKNSKIPHCENISKVQQKNCRNKMENKYYPIIVTVPKSNKKKHRKNQNRYLFTVNRGFYSHNGEYPNIYTLP